MTTRRITPEMALAKPVVPTSGYKRCLRVLNANRSGMAV